jgi:hypothetical protein
VISSVNILKNSTWIPLDSTHIKSEFCRRRMISRIPRRRQWGLPSENANGWVGTHQALPLYLFHFQFVVFFDRTFH